MSPLDAAILRTIIYADVFNFPLNVVEIHHFLIHDESIDIERIEHALSTSTWLDERIERIQNCWILRGRTGLIDLRIQREQASHQLWPKALGWGGRLARLPFVRMVALTGALAMHNAADDDDDLDYLLVTQPGRVWLARAFAILMVRIGRLRGVEICPNYIISDDRLMQNRCDLFTAHEITQMVPLYGFQMYRCFCKVNVWTSTYLPNANTVFHAAPEAKPGWIWSNSKRGLEWLLSGWIGDKLENWEYRRKSRRFIPQSHTEDSAAEIDNQTVKGHFNDYGHPALRRYQELLRQYDVEERPSLSPVGD